MAGDKLFSGFFVSGSIRASQITVIPIEDEFGFGMRFSGPIVAIGNTAKDIILGYTVTVATNLPYAISAVHQALDGFVISTASESVTEHVLTSSLVFVGQNEAFITPTTSHLAGVFPVYPVYTQLIVSNRVLLTASFPGAANIFNFEQTFSEATLIPEPSTLALLISGLWGVYLMRRRIRSCR